MNALLRCFGLLVVAGLVTSLLACGGATEGGGSPSEETSAGTTPPPVNTRFALRIDGKAVDLEEPAGTRFVNESGKLPTYISIAAEQDPRGGDYIRGASVGLVEPFETGTFDCTPNERGEIVGKQATFNPGDFFGFKATLTDCVVTVQYIVNDRAVGTFSAKGHAPEGSSLSGTVAKAEGEFDVPIKELKL